MMEANELETAAEACSAGTGRIAGESYPYQQLEHENSIRLLVITPVSGEDVTYTLQHAELGKIRYKALSYEWGLSSEDDPTITIDGHPARIRKNLFEGLEQIRSIIHKPRPLRLWVDALCINQNDNAEKSQQVQKMGRIFEGASQVIAWIGPKADDSDYAMDILNSSDPYKERTSMAEKFKDNYRAKSAILDLCERPYWKRVWIIQELFLAIHLVVVCGSKCIEGKQLDVCLKYIVWGTQNLFSTLQPDDIDIFRVLLERSPANKQIHARRLGTTRSNTLLRWLYICATSKIMATDPRDYIYAVLSISHEIYKGCVQIIPDYNKPAKIVFEETSSAMVDMYEQGGGVWRQGKLEDFEMNEVVNAWLTNEVGLDVRIEWHDKVRYG